MAKLEAIEGVGPAYAEALRKAGIGSTDSLLEKGATPAGRKEIAKACGIRDALTLEWVNQVDLFRIKGVGPQYADLLEEAGVDTVVELSRRDPQKLFEKLAAVNAQKNCVNKLPAQSQVKNWVEQAKKMPRKISY
jgi:predicted flap endonuclease-1-like 5' DNA nuclease